MSSPSPRNDADEAPKASMFTEGGLPLNHASFGTALSTVDVGEGGPARRVECRPPQLISAPSLLASKTPQFISVPSTTSTLAFKTPSADSWSSLAVGVNSSSLMDDDDEEELVDYFGKSGAGAPLDGPTLFPAAACDDATLSRPSWIVREHNVPTLPSFYPLDKSAVFVPQASAPILASRIAAVLQARSIAASYDSQNAKVDCVSRSHVEFRVRLYRGRDEFDHGIIVEVQRRAGFYLGYAHDVNAILDAAEGKSEDDAGVLQPPIYHEETKLEEDMDYANDSGGFASLRVISSILCPPGDTVAGTTTVEGREIAMASLAFLTNFERMGQTAVQLSHELLASETCADLRRVVFSQVGQDQNQTPDRVLLQALEILANVTNNCSHSPSRLAILLSQNDHDILKKLVANIDNVATNPHVANLSCLILRNICVSQVNVEDLIPPDSRARWIGALINAVDYGGQYHAELQRHSQYCLELII